MLVWPTRTAPSSLILKQFDYNEIQIDSIFAVQFHEQLESLVETSSISLSNGVEAQHRRALYSSSMHPRALVNYYNIFQQVFIHL